MPSSPTKHRGQVTYSDQFGHVCTCTEKPVGAEGNQDAHWTIYEYENTVTADRASGTETGSYWYSCSRCGAGTWSGL